MALPITNISLESDIAPEFLESATLETCCLSANVNKNGLNPTYCPGATPDLRLVNLRNDRKQSYFKGYDIGTGGLSLNYAFNSGLSDDFLEVYDVTLTASGGFNINANIGFELQFTSGTIPSGQDDRRTLRIDNLDQGGSITLSSSNAQSSIFTTFNVGDTVRNFRYTYENDNWDSPRPSSTFRTICHGDYQLSVTSGEEQSVIVQGVTTTTLTLVSDTSTDNNTYDIVDIPGNVDISNYSGEGIITLLTRQAGPSYTPADGYKDVQVVENYNTGTSNSNRKFIQILEDGITSPFDTYTGSTFSHGAEDFTTLTTVSNYPTNGFRARYAIINSSGVSSSYSYTISPFLYCSFSPLTINKTISSVTSSDTLIYVKELSSISSTRVQLDQVLLVAGTNTNISLGDTYTYRFTARCPQGTTIDVRNQDNTALAILSDGQSYTIDNAGQGFGFITTESPIDSNSTYLSRGQIFTIGDIRFDISSALGEYIEMEGVTNCVTGIGPYRWKFDNNGTIA